MTTDVLFELWDSMAKDNPQSVQSRPQSEVASAHCSSLPRNLGHGLYGSFLKTNNEHHPISCDVSGDASEPIDMVGHFDPMHEKMHADEPGKLPTCMPTRVI
ncbi:unnamed protein product [Echinostoma caproni]|uniref:Uncharacterized protein n=1 Tax=Echinostoma caproni TaxID=27848 RepID=A0A183AGM3_9TREM|nr:unnamed protein product [Echinostoma caproni]